MNYYTFLFFCLLCALFLNTDAAAYSGVTMLTTTAFTPMIVVVLMRYAKNKIRISSKSIAPSIIVFLLSVIIIIVKLLIDEDVVRKIFNFTIIPICIIGVAFDNISGREKKIFRKALLFFFIVECLLAIIERILQKRFFDTIYTAERYDYLTFQQFGWQFRSTSLLGHPLENAMAVSIILVFILFSNLTFYRKVLFFCLGYASLFCFNARGAIIVVSFLLLPFLFRNTLMKFKRWRFFTVSVLLIITFTAGYLIFTSNLGGRLINSEKLVDASSLERVNVFSYLSYINPDKLLLGDIDSYKFLLIKLDLVGIENGVITAILMYGYLMAIPLLISLFYFQWRKLHVFGKLYRMVILLTFWSLGFVNPNLVDPTQWYTFVFALLAFKPENYHNVYEKKIENL